MKRLVLARHGNTFRPEDKPVWVGARSDLSLVEKGIAQARALGEALKQARISPVVVMSGPLLRTRETTSIALETLGISQAVMNIDDRLKEIDYGAWEGLSTPEIEAAGGGAELAAWNKHSLFPTSPGWSPDEAHLTVDVAMVLAEVADGTSLIVTSNGILRFFARVAVNAGDFPERKVATGHICVMECEGHAWRIIQWNAPPAVLTQGSL